MFSKLAPLSARLVRAPKLAVAMRPAVRTFAAAAGGAKTGVMSIPARYPMAFGMPGGAAPNFCGGTAPGAF